MKKIFVSKNDSVAEVVEKIIDESDSEIVLVIPKNTSLEESISNFHLIKRESAAADKNVIIESVDEGVLALAKASHLEAVHPLFKKNRKASSLSDIVPASRKEAEEASETDETEEGGDDETEEDASSRNPSLLARAKASVKERVSLPVEKKKLPIFRLVIGLFTLIILAWSFFYLSAAFSHAKVLVNFKEIPWQLDDIFAAKTSVAEIDNVNNLIPAEVLEQTKNISQSFPASGRDQVKEKATGKIIVYNAYSSAAQPLVATTRFLTPEGKIFRLVKGITVPGAEVKDGKIIPSTIETEVVADQPGEEYNLGPVSRMSIPGFKGTPKYDAFYGSLIKSSGGFVGEKAVPTEKDIAVAKETVTKLLESSAQSEFLNDSLKKFKILEGASKTSITSLTASKTTDDKGNFSVSGEVLFKAVAFSEDDLKDIIFGVASDGNSKLVFKDISIDYQDIRVDFDKGEIKFSISSQGSLTQDFSPEAFRDQIVGKKIGDVKSLVLSLNGLDDAKVSIWPSWIKKLPKKGEKIDISVE